MSRAIARLQVVAAALLFSTGGAGIKVAAFSAPQVSALRSGIAIAALLIWLRGRLTWSTASIGIGLVYAATLTLFVASTRLTTAANAIFLQSTAPLYLLVLAPVLLGERFRRRDLGYLGALASGLVLCVADLPPATTIAPDPLTGNLLGILSGVAWALTLLALRYVERDHARQGVGLSAVVAGNAIAFAGALPFALPLPPAPAVEWATVLYLGVFQIGLAYVCLTAAMRHVPALDASILLLIEPVLNPVWTWLFRGEEPGGWTLAGGAVILATTAAKSLHDGRAAAATKITKP